LVMRLGWSGCTYLPSLCFTASPTNASKSGPGWSQLSGHCCCGVSCCCCWLAPSGCCSEPVPSGRLLLKGPGPAPAGGPLLGGRWPQPAPSPPHGCCPGGPASATHALMGTPGVLVASMGSGMTLNTSSMPRRSSPGGRWGVCGRLPGLPGPPAGSTGENFPLTMGDSGPSAAAGPTATPHSCQSLAGTALPATPSTKRSSTAASRGTKQGSAAGWPC
jgi:hypothetical protein